MAPAANSFTELDGGTGANTFIVRATSDLTEVNGGTGSNTYFAGNASGSINQILGGLDFTGAGTGTPVAVAHHLPRRRIRPAQWDVSMRSPSSMRERRPSGSYAVASNVVQRGVRRLRYRAMTDLTVNTAQGTDLIDVLSTGNAMNTTVNGDGLNNTFLVMATGVGNNLFYSGTGSDVFRVFSTGAGSFNQLNGLAGDAFYISTTGVNSLAEINGGPTSLFASIGADQGSPYGLLTSLLGEVSVNGNVSGSASNQMMIHDEANVANTSYTLEDLAFRHTTNKPANGAPALMPIAFTHIQTLTANIGAGIDLMTIKGTPATQQTTISGGGGADFFDTFGTSGKTSLNGGARAAVFDFENEPTLSGGAIHGQTGSDEIDLLGYSVATRIDLQERCCHEPGE